LIISKVLKLTRKHICPPSIQNWAIKFWVCWRSSHLLPTPSTTHFHTFHIWLQMRSLHVHITLRSPIVGIVGSWWWRVYAGLATTTQIIFNLSWCTTLLTLAIQSELASSEMTLWIMINHYNGQRKKIKNLVMGPTPRRTGWLTVGCNLTSTSKLRSIGDIVKSERRWRFKWNSQINSLASTSFTEEHASLSDHKWRARSPSSLPSSNAVSWLRKQSPGHGKQETTSHCNSSACTNLEHQPF
jgi:hypothetical protein